MSAYDLVRQQRQALVGGRLAAFWGGSRRPPGYRPGQADGLWVDVVSSNVAAVMYDPIFFDLFVAFHRRGRSPAIYVYHGVARDWVYGTSGILESYSMGRYVWARFRRSGFTVDHVFG